MNVIKFQDILIEDDKFNEYFKGKYCYAICWNTCVPVDELSFEKYKDSEQLSLQNGKITIVGNVHEILLENYKEYIDTEETLKVNNNIIEHYTYLNKFTTDDDITLDEIRKFRTWLADILYENQAFIHLYTTDVEKLNHMLQYYKQEMNDETIYSLSTFTGLESVNIINTSSCGCSHSSNIITGITNCEPLSIYKNQIYYYMCTVFSDINYWTPQLDICKEFKKYIDNIINLNLPLTTNTITNIDCINIDISEQDLLMNILKNLSKALEYIITCDIEGHKNFISNSFTSWAVKLYEKMRW